MSHRAINLQDAFLNQVRKEGIPVIVALTTGEELRGEVKGFDNFTIVLTVHGVESLVYKHAVASIVPVRSLPQAGSMGRSIPVEGRN